MFRIYDGIQFSSKKERQPILIETKKTKHYFHLR